MSFPKDTKRARDKAAELRGHPIQDYDGIDLLLNTFEVFSSGNFGERITLYCKTEAGEDVKLSTFSGVIIAQARDMKDELPIIITPANNGNYFTIY